ncbi:hypothetical protein KIPB_009924, partial [Kipferlia bialata]
AYESLEGDLHVHGEHRDRDSGMESGRESGSEDEEPEKRFDATRRPFARKAASKSRGPIRGRKRDTTLVSLSSAVDAQHILKGTLTMAVTSYYTRLFLLGLCLTVLLLTVSMGLPLPVSLYPFLSALNTLFICASYAIMHIALSTAGIGLLLRRWVGDTLMQNRSEKERGSEREREREREREDGDGHRPTSLTLASQVSIAGSGTVGRVFAALVALCSLCPSLYLDICIRLGTLSVDSSSDPSLPSVVSVCLGINLVCGAILGLSALLAPFSVFGTAGGVRVQGMSDTSHELSSLVRDHLSMSKGSRGALVSLEAGEESAALHKEGACVTLGDALGCFCAREGMLSGGAGMQYILILFSEL